jgi:hypothetical protein
VTREQAAAAARGGEVEIVASRWLGGAWTQDRLWERLGIGAAISRAGWATSANTTRSASASRRRQH